FLSLVSLLLIVTADAAHAASTLRICADPDNLPFSNRAGGGFDNRIAALAAREIGRRPEFVWVRSRRGFLREQFNRNACDLLTGVPQGMRGVATTRPYYRSAYVFVTRAREHVRIASFDDPRLNGRRIGLQILEEDLSPPSLPLIRSGHATQLVGFPSFGKQAGAILRAVADGQVGVAVVWGPVAGYYAKTQPVPLAITPVSPAVDSSGVPFVYSISMAVHTGDSALRDALNRALLRLQPEIQRILTNYHVPLLGGTAGAA
ncbi:MAG TPA: quinoprotein dehydrogenase-associated putative ABC transporter substrate-binding protein, partial [Acidobacteriaceae bacterium]|nr:quinoprotein dehydrogenase-associated putative ABC transporter substrate-binding protein [Acidobacteriaceae bacterium]